MAKIQIKSEKLTPLVGIFSGNGAIFPNTDFSDLSDYQMNLYSFPLDFPNTDFSDLTDYQMNQMNLYSFQLVFSNKDFSDLTDYQKNQMNLYSFPLVFSNTDFSDLTDYQKNQMNLYSFPQLDSTSSSVIYLTFGLSLDRSISWHVFSPWQSLSKLSSAHLA